MEGQQLYLTNPSFEDIPRVSAVPKTWLNCGFMDSSPPDIQPCDAWEAPFIPPQNGFTYISMVTRNDDTYESIGQKLMKPLEKDSLYEFSIQLAMYETYISLDPKSIKINQDRGNADMSNIPTKDFTTPICLRIWGGNSECILDELLQSTPPIDHYDWKKYTLQFKPDETYNYLILEAYYEEDFLVSYCGNIMLDNCSLTRSPSTSIDSTHTPGNILKYITELRDHVDKSINATICKNIISVWSFSQKSKQNNILDFINTYSATEQGKIITAMHSMLLIDNAFALEQLIDDLKTNPEDQQNILQEYSESVSRENIDQQVLNYISENKEDILEELVKISKK